jgi:hypothetical protein
VEKGDELIMWFTMLKSVQADNIKIKEAVNKVYELLGEPDRVDEGEIFYAEKGDFDNPEEFVYYLHYVMLSDSPPTDYYDFGSHMYAKLTQEGTEEFGLGHFTENYPKYVAGSFYIELFIFNVVVSEANPELEDIAQELHNYFEKKYGITGEEFQSDYTTGSTSPEIGEGEEVEPKGDDWRESLRGGE